MPRKGRGGHRALPSCVGQRGHLVTKWTWTCFGRTVFPLWCHIFFLLETPWSEMRKPVFNNECTEWWEQGYLCDFIFNSPCPLKSCAWKQLKINYLPSPERTFHCCSWSHPDTWTINPRLQTQVTQPIKQLSAAGPGEVLPNIPGEDNYSYLIWLWNEIIKSLVPFCKFSSS